MQTPYWLIRSSYHSSFSSDSTRNDYYSRNTVSGPAITSIGKTKQLVSQVSEAGKLYIITNLFAALHLKLLKYIVNIFQVSLI